MIDLAAFIRTLPKADLHVHLEGASPPNKVVRIGHQNGVDVFESVAVARAAYDVSSLDDFLVIFAKSSEVLLDADESAEVAPVDWALCQKRTCEYLSVSRHNRTMSINECVSSVTGYGFP